MGLGGDDTGLQIKELKVDLMIDVGDDGHGTEKRRSWIEAS